MKRSGVTGEALAIQPKEKKPCATTTTELAVSEPAADTSKIITVPDGPMQESITQLETEWDNRIGKGTFAESDELATWYMGKVNEIEQMRETIKHQAAAMLNQLDNRMAGLQYRWGGQFRAVVDRKLHMGGHKKKSVDLLTGRAGYRTSPDKVEIVDGEAAAEWAAFNCPEALGTSIKRTSPIKDYIKATGEIPPGIRYVEKQETFYPAISTKQLTPSHSPQLEQDTQ
jgi:phage host-nuclease inhibitor protein Gam